MRDKVAANSENMDSESNLDTQIIPDDVSNVTDSYRRHNHNYGKKIRRNGK